LPTKPTRRSCDKRDNPNGVLPSHGGNNRIANAQGGDYLGLIDGCATIWLPDLVSYF
jgi:hypothetical protein